MGAGIEKGWSGMGRCREADRVKGGKVAELNRVLQAEISKSNGADGLVAQVDELIESHHTEPLLSTTSASAAIGELARRNEGLEQAVRALALAVENLGSS
jgi:hypothetical protein